MPFEYNMSAEQIDGWGFVQGLKAQCSKSLFLRMNDSTQNHQQEFKGDRLNERNVFPPSP